MTLNQAQRAQVNRDNARHSTGPRTEEGKAASSRNAFKHGLYAEQLIMPGECAAALEALKSDLRAEHQPGTVTEEILVNEMAEHFWRLRRMRRYEVRAMEPENFENWFNLIPIIGRMMTAAERGFHKALTALRQLQKARGFVPQIAAVSDTVEVPTAATPAESFPPIGFVSQNELVAAITPAHSQGEHASRAA